MKRKIYNLLFDDDNDGGGGGWKGADRGGGSGWKGGDSGGGGWKGADGGGGGEWKEGDSGGWKGGDSGGGVGWKGGDNSGSGGGWTGCDNGGSGGWKCCDDAGGWKGGKNSRSGCCSVGWNGRDNGGGSGGGGDNKVGGSWKGGNIDGGWKGGNSAGGGWEGGNSGGGWKGGDSGGRGWGSSATDGKKSWNQGGGSGDSGDGWAGKNTELDTLLEKLIDSVLLMNDKVEGISNRVNKLEQKMNEEIMLGKKERTEFMNEVKSELAKLKKSQEKEQTVFVGSHLVSKLSKLQKSVESNLPVDIASTSKGRRLSTSHLDVQQPSGWDKHSDVQQPSQVHSPGNSPNQVYSYLDMSDFDRSNITPSEGHWRPPCENVTKLNVGVVVSFATAACGVIARDDLAEFKGCCTESLLVHSFEEAEAKAFLTGVQFAVRNGLKNVVIEGDAQNIITILNDADHPVPSSIRSVIEQIRMLVEMPLPAIEFRFIKKSGNMLAHTLASYAKSNLIDQSWESFPPPIIASLLFEESLLAFG